jgi:pyruvate/2-oxoglutarate dehydrogenase complex dihydrolipoamide acyltransferase (E2) component
MATEVIIPKIGQTVEACQLLEWLVEKGDTVEQGEPIFAIETDKVSFDIEAPASGILKEVFFEAGAEVPVMTVVGVIESADEDMSGYVKRKT